MTAATWIGCGLLGAIGAIARAEVTAIITRRHGITFPWGTLAVNLSGAFALGLLHGSGAGGETAVLIGAALLGSFTTFSTWMVETLRLYGSSPAKAWANITGALLTGLALAAVGSEIGSALWA